MNPPVREKRSVREEDEQVRLRVRTRLVHTNSCHTQQHERWQILQSSSALTGARSRIAGDGSWTSKPSASSCRTPIFTNVNTKIIDSSFVHQDEQMPTTPCPSGSPMHKEDTRMQMMQDSTEHIEATGTFASGPWLAGLQSQHLMHTCAFPPL